MESNVVNITKVKVMTGDYNNLSTCNVKNVIEGTHLQDMTFNALYPLSKFSEPFYVPKLHNRPDDLKWLNKSTKQFGLNSVTKDTPAILIGQSDANLFPTDLSYLPSLYKTRVPVSLKKKYPNLIFSLSKITGNVIVSGSLEGGKSKSNISNANEKKITNDKNETPIDQSFLKRFFEQHKKNMISFVAQFGQRVTCPLGTDPVVGNEAL